MALVIYTKFTFAQQFNLSSPPIDEKLSIGLKYNRIFPKDGDELSTLSGVYKLYGIFPLKNNWQINAEIPSRNILWFFYKRRFA
jgi:hypothetical protein